MPRHIAPESPSISIVRRDPDGARSWMSTICGPHLLRVGSPQRLHFEHAGNILKSMSTTLGVIAYGTDVAVGIENGAPLNCYSVSLPLSGQQELASNGQLILSDRDTGVVVSPETTQELNIAGDCRKMLVAITRPAMRQVLEDLLQRPAEQPLIFVPGMDAANGLPASWWRMVQHLIGEMNSGSAELYENNFFSNDLEKALIKGLILSQPNNYSALLKQSRDTRLPHYFTRARDFIHANARENLSLEDIEAVAGVPRYKLFETFKQMLGMPPMAYLKKHRLEQVRRGLLEDLARTNISSIALDWGFNHLGRFSVDYRKLFGESPSDTLARQLVKKSL